MNDLLKRKQPEKKVTLTSRDRLYQSLFNSAHGAKVIEDLKKTLHHGKNLYHPGQTNSDLHYELGRQSVINDILYTLSKEGT